MPYEGQEKLTSDEFIELYVRHILLDEDIAQFMLAFERRENDHDVIDLVEQQPESNTQMRNLTKRLYSIQHALDALN